MLGLTDFKRYRMEIDLEQDFRRPVGWACVPRRSDLLSAHAEAKYLSFRNGIDANVFPGLGRA